MNVSEFMTKEVISLAEDRTVEEAARLMMEKNISALPIVDSTNKLVGILTESDFIGRDADIPHALASLKRVLGQVFYSGNIESLFNESKNKPLKAVMTELPKTIGPDNTLSDAVNMMTRHDLKRIPVVQNKILVGIITRHDIVKAFTLMDKDSSHPSA